MKTYLGYSYSLMDEMAASPVLPTPEARRTYQLLRMWSSFVAMQAGRADWDDLDVVTDIGNLLETLKEMGVALDGARIVPSAKAALMAAIERRGEGQYFNLQPAECIAVETALRAYQDVLEALPHRIMIRCHRRTEKAKRDALMGRAGKADVIEVRA